MDFSLEDTQNSAPGLSTMAEQQKLNVAPRKADTQSVTKRLVLTFNSLLQQNNDFVAYNQN